MLISTIYGKILKSVTDSDRVRYCIVSLNVHISLTLRNHAHKIFLKISVLLIYNTIYAINYSVLYFPTAIPIAS